MEDDFVLVIRYLLKLDWSYAANTMFVAGIGAFGGFIELISRYSNVEKLKRIRAGWVYIALNAAIAGLVYIFMMEGNLQINFGKYKSGAFANVLLAGTSSMVLLRSAIVNVKLQNQDVSVGLAPILQVLLNWVNRNYDRENSRMDLEEVSRIMEDVDFEILERNLEPLCTAMMKTLSVEEMSAIGNRVSEIAQDVKIDTYTKKLNLGLYLAPFMGTELLSDSVSQLKKITQKQTVVNPVDLLLEEYNSESN